MDNPNDCWMISEQLPWIMGKGQGRKWKWCDFISSWAASRWPNAWIWRGHFLLRVLDNCVPHSLWWSNQRGSFSNSFIIILYQLLIINGQQHLRGSRADETFIALAFGQPPKRFIESKSSRSIQQSSDQSAFLFLSKWPRHCAAEGRDEETWGLVGFWSWKISPNSQRRLAEFRCWKWPHRFSFYALNRFV